MYYYVLPVLISAKLLLSSSQHTNDWRNFSYFIDASILFYSIFLLIIKKAVDRKKYVDSIIFIGGMFLLICLSAVVNGKELFGSVVNLLRTFTPIIMFLSCVLAFKKSNGKPFAGIFLLIFVIYFLTFIGFLMYPAVSNRNATWLPVYIEGLHTSAYTMMGAAVLLFIAFTNSRFFHLKVVYGFLITISFLIVWFGWGVRTVIVVSVIFCYLNIFDVNKGAKINLALSVVVLLLLVFLGEINTKNWDDFSSGRFSMYYEKFIQLSRNNIYTWLLGNGYGSDLIETDVWWWEEKGAHNDYLTFLVENGLLFMILFLSFIYYLYKNYLKDKISKALFVAVLLSGVISNGFLVRPSASYVIYWAAAVSIALSERAKRKHSHN